MAINDTAVFAAAKGYIYTAPVGTNPPTVADIDAFDPDTGITSLQDDGTTVVPWVSVGHTSDDELPSFGFEGGDTTTKGSWQNSALKQVVEDQPVDHVTFNLLQFDVAALELYYGTANASAVAGNYGVSDTPSGSTDKALLIVLVDGDFKVGFHVTKSAIKREGEIALDIAELSELPLKATFLKMTGKLLFEWVALS